jgi:uncharacterized membrane protein
VLRVDPVGLVLGTAFAILAMTPSLLPRDWLFQGMVSGLSGAAGYGVGVALAWAANRSIRWQGVRDRVRRRSPRWAPRAAWAVLLVAVPAALVTMLLVAAQWQREVAALLAIEEPTTGGWLRAGPLLAGVWALVVVVTRGVRWLSRLIEGLLRRWARLPRRVASVAGLLLAGFLLVIVVNDVMLQRALSVADSAFAAANTEDFPGVEQPGQSTRSGSPASLVPWPSLGREGRRFVTGGPSPEQLAAHTGNRTGDPVRVYAGLLSADSAQARAQLALAELDRTGAFDRQVLVLASTTGSGWVNATAVDAVELMYGGDTAVVAVQYSYLPSWLSFVVDRSRSEQAAQALFEVVSARLAELPETQQPKLLVFGESLGSRGSESVFDTLADIRAGADGVLWVGPPNSNRVWRSLVERRDPGSAEVAPVYASGLVVRFAGDVDDLHRPSTPWEAPRVLYLQHPSDPVVWWAPKLWFTRPDWLVEPRGADVSPSMSWYPVVTFWQVTADLTNAESVPDGHGHNYDDLIVRGWVAVAAPAGWTEADTARVERTVLQLREEQAA